MKKVVLFLLFHVAMYGQSQAIERLVYEIRDPKTDSAHFRKALESIGEYLALQALEELEGHERRVTTLTGVEAVHYLVDEKPVLATIMRAGLPLNAGVQKVFPDSEVGFFAMSRNEETLKADVSYVALPDMRGKTVILSDTMLGTGGSLLNAIQRIETLQPKRIIVIAAIASHRGIDQILKHDSKILIFAAAIDPELNHKGYIIPGLGDAGDRCYGKKCAFKREDK